MKQYSRKISFIIPYLIGKWFVEYGAADGPTAVFYAGKLGDTKPWLWGVVGIVVIAAGIIRIIRARR